MSIFIDKDNRMVNIYAPYTDTDGNRYSNLMNPEIRELVGIMEIPDPPMPEDYSEDTYYRTEQPEAPYIVYTRKSLEQIEEQRKAKIQSQIDSLEAANLLPRVAREFMLIQFEAVAAQQGVDPMTNFGYRKVKELDDTIAALRAQL